MAGHESSDIPSARPLDAERAKLKEQGYSDAEISQILIARAVGGHQPASAAPTGPGVLSNTISSIVAIAGHARALIPSFRSDFVTLSRQDVSVAARLGATFSLIVKLAVVCVLTYAGWQEWQQHIINQTKIQEAEVGKRKAEECSARAKVIMDTVPLNKVSEAMAVVQRDCDPTFASRAAKCEAGYQELLADAEHVTESEDKLNALLKKSNTYQEGCTLTQAQLDAIKKRAVDAVAKGPSPEEQRKAVEAILPVIDQVPMFTELAKSARAAVAQKDYPKAASIVKPATIYVKTLMQISEADKKGDMAAALKAAEEMRDAIVQPGVVNKDQFDKQREAAFVSVAWFSLMTKDYAKALAASDKAISFAPDDLVPKTNKAHALLMLRRVDEAKAIYFQYRGQPIIDGKIWDQVIRDDFVQLRKAGVDSPDMTYIDRMLKPY